MVKTIYSLTNSRFGPQSFQLAQQHPTGPIVNAVSLRIHSIRPASGRALVCVALCDGLGVLPQQPLLNQYPGSIQALQPKLWDCADEDRVSPGGGSA
jgi:hypothetical protein